MSTSSFLSLLLPLLTTNFGNVQSFAPVLGRGKASGGRSVSFQRDPPVLLRTGTLDNILVTESTNPDSTNTKEEFNWFKAWYPLVPVEILDREQPHRFQLLGEDIVVWNDGPVEGHGKFVSKKKRPRGAQRSEGTWRAFVDQSTLLNMLVMRSSLQAARRRGGASSKTSRTPGRVSAWTHCPRTA